MGVMCIMFKIIQAVLKIQSSCYLPSQLLVDLHVHQQGILIRWPVACGFMYMYLPLAMKTKLGQCKEVSFLGITHREFIYSFLESS